MRTSRAFGTALAWTLAAVAGCDPQGDRAGPDGVVVAPACPEGVPAGELADKPTVDVLVNGDGPFTFVYDTGAPVTVIDSRVRERVGAGPYAFEVAGRTLAAATVRPADLVAFGIAGAAGILGTDLLDGLAVTVDRRRGRLWLEDAVDEAALEACGHAAPSPGWIAVTVASYLYVEGRVEDLPGWLLLDSGATLGALTEGTFAELQARRPRPALGGFYTPAAIGAFWASLASVGSLAIGDGLEVEHLAIRTVPEGVLPAAPGTRDGRFLGLLPNGFLRHFLLTVDYPGARIRLAPFTDDERREPSFAYPVGIGLEAMDRTPARIAEVLPGSAAEAEGVAVGDEVLRIGTTDVASLSLDRRPWALLAPSLGATVSVTVARDGVARELVLDGRDLLGAPER